MTTDFATRAAFIDEMGLGPVWVRRAVPEAGAAGEATAAASASVTQAAAPYSPGAAPVPPADLIPASKAAADADATAENATTVSEPMRTTLGVSPARAHEANLKPNLKADLRADHEADHEAAHVRALASAWDESDQQVQTPASERSANADTNVDTNVDTSARADIGSMDWDELARSVQDCSRCGLCGERSQPVFGVGDQKARWLFVGEAPGREEEKRGEPFVGPSGQLLDNMLAAMQLKRGENVYITNVVKCRPTDENGRDRRPAPAECASCLPYLERQIALIRPTVIVALGKTAALSLLGLDPATPLTGLLGRVHRYQDLPLIVTYHPAYLLRKPIDKKQAWADLCLAMATYARAD